jgi:hypothetical protein
MPLSIVGEFLLQAIFEVVFGTIGYFLGQVVVAVFTLGRIKCDRPTADTPRRKGRWGGTYHRRGGRIYLTAEATTAIGVVFLFLIGGGFLIYYL